MWFVRLETCFWQISQNPELLPGFGEGTGVVRPSRERVELRSIAAIKVVQGLGIDGFEAFRNEVKNMELWNLWINRSRRPKRVIIV